MTSRASLAVDALSKPSLEWKPEVCLGDYYHRHRRQDGGRERVEAVRRHAQCLSVFNTQANPQMDPQHLHQNTTPTHSVRNPGGDFCLWAPPAHTDRSQEHGDSSARCPSCSLPALSPTERASSALALSKTPVGGFFSLLPLPSLALFSVIPPQVLWLVVEVFHSRHRPGA